MPITSESNPERTTTAVVTIRIPCGANGDLGTDAEERLLQVDDIDSVSIDELYGIEPKLSATVITVGVTLQWTTTMTTGKAREKLAGVPGLASIEQNG